MLYDLMAAPDWKSHIAGERPDRDRIRCRTVRSGSRYLDIMLECGRARLAALESKE